MSDLQKVGLKVFLREPKRIEPGEFIPIFHRWIQERKIEGTLIDVADYTHVPGGPGLILVGIEGDIYLDETGLLYVRKFPLEGTPAERIRRSLLTALDAASLLEKETRLRFGGEKVRLIVNDRLAAPNTDRSFEAIGPHLKEALEGIYAKGLVTVSRDLSDPRGRLSIDIRSSVTVDVVDLVQRASLIAA